MKVLRRALIAVVVLIALPTACVLTYGALIYHNASKSSPALEGEPTPLARAESAVAMETALQRRARGGVERANASPMRLAVGCHQVVNYLGVQTSRLRPVELPGRIS